MKTPLRMILPLIIVGMLFISYERAHASMLTFVSDTISTSAPESGASHAIQFTPLHAIPASGEIIITPQAGVFSTPSDIDYTDVGLSVSDGGGPYADRSLAATADADNDGVAVVSGSAGSITITLDSTTGIAAGDTVRIVIGTGGDTIVNPATIQSYGIAIATKDPGGAPIEEANAMIAVVAPVSLVLPTDVLRPTVFGGLPSGEVAAGNPTIELSVETIAPATCRYATSSGEAYGSMPYAFSSDASGMIFFADVSGFQDGESYDFYVRCMNGLGNPNDSDYPISFFLDPTPSILTSSSASGTGATAGGEGYLGPGGTGSFPNGSAYLYLASVTLSGLSIPLSTVTVLNDGVVTGNTQAGADGSFKVAVSGLERGTYTFDVYGQDDQGQDSAPVSSTLTVGQATQNSISNLIVPPTIELSKVSISAGDSLEASGQGIPDAPIQVIAQLQSPTASAADTHTYTATSSAAGDWQAPIDTTLFADGKYTVTAQEILSAQTESGLSDPVSLSVGENGSACSASTDMNHDGKVNLIDFSIFLTYWGMTGPQGDFNCDHQVNLSDFSIMLFNWTG